MENNCRFFKGNIPCEFNKKHGISCIDCEYKKSYGTKILIFKLGSAGDVLRTNFILPLLKEKYDDAQIFWVVSDEYIKLIDNNPYIDEIIPWNFETSHRLKIEEFDVLINLEMEKNISAFATTLDIKEKFGFGLSKKGYIAPFNKEAEYLYSISCSDNEKKKNKMTYQEILIKTLNLKGRSARPYFKLKNNQNENLKFLYNDQSIDNNKSIIGLNIGTGKKWISKRYPLKNWVKLYELLKKNGFQPLFLAGPEEKNMLEELKSMGNFAISGPELSFETFAEVISELECIITGDTFALHLALALETNLIALFSSTSPDEIDIFDSGLKLKTKKECTCYYNKECTSVDPCMDSITPEKLFQLISEKKYKNSN